ncbi:MAG: transglycosylase SLT domain-containing protein [Cyanobacteria bacterium]|nr:transglycosylase SLT domain-containing protein [Cyanobacteria bacterium CG_2015-16_32_12]NCO78647.1 transglycosylase SLT domain-containing protein [Cyanobacteria bacterium CG_2015-22_32_23]NCQ04652.1 transglycosylase SLT domain-containing protein [Cyanobacteria bacterium CG_2015-09_32_10]NCQ42516.1 transglycosylase SLT domain-containing protein [Cyanobacteria bacterium CG_2015-04_32_10]NCS85995.1 transglycosylase SLT domain-containing protein [Cyanobacteria bacterium CG_2015-02_32_10]
MKTKKSKNRVSISTVALIIAGIAGATILTPKLVTLLGDVVISPTVEKTEYRLDAPSEVLPLADIPPKQRQTALEAIAGVEKPSLDRSRARFLLASDILRSDFDGAKALDFLKKLEKEYPVLTPYILLRRGRAYELTNDTEKAQEIWQQLVTEFPTELVAAEAYYKLGNYEPNYWQEAINRFPQYPRTHEIARKLLEKNPKQKNLLFLLATYDLSPQTKPILDRLVKEFSKELQPSEWEIIANNYWQNGNYLQASKAYEKATSTPENLYRIARGYQVSNKKTEAKSFYLKLVNQFPDAPDTGLGLRRLASLNQGDEAISYLNKVDKRFPKEAPKALSQKATILTLLGRFPEATQVRNQLLQQFPNSDEAGDYRWQVAQEFARSNNLVSAWQWAQQISVNNPDSDVAPKAGFWVGKWAEKLGQKEESAKAFQFVLQKYPHSYYAWRSAVRLGKDVGDFTTIRSLPLKVVTPQTRPIPPAGSNMFKELFLIGENQEAIDLFRGEIGNKQEITVSEQFIQGLIKQIQGENLQGINTIWELKNRRDNTEDYQEWQILRNSPEYWHGLFPFHYEDLIVKWSTERKLNPFLVVSLIRQESRFEKEIKSPVGATGLMQIMPDTGKWIAPQIKLEKYSLTDPNDNIKMGTWYLNHTHETYNGNSLLAVASYNAGPGNVANWLKRYPLDDFDEFVENIPFPETKGYIESVFANYWNYVELYEPQIQEKIQ